MEWDISSLNYCRMYRHHSEEKKHVQILSVWEHLSKLLFGTENAVCHLLSFFVPLETLLFSIARFQVGLGQLNLGKVLLSSGCSLFLVL